MAITQSPALIFFRKQNLLGLGHLEEFIVKHGFQDELENWTVCSGCSLHMGITKWHQNHLKKALEAIDNKRVNTWDWPWHFSLAAQNQLTIFPKVNLVPNIGFGQESTHTHGRASAAILQKKA